MSTFLKCVKYDLQFCFHKGCWPIVEVISVFDTPMLPIMFSFSCGDGSDNLYQCLPLIPCYFQGYDVILEDYNCLLKDGTLLTMLIPQD